MAAKKSDDDQDDSQPALVPMSDDELRSAGRLLAKKVRDLERMEIEHKEERQERKAQRDKLRESISGLAESVRTQGR